MINFMVKVFYIQILNKILSNKPEFSQIASLHLLGMDKHVLYYITWPRGLKLVEMPDLAGISLT
jgi:hypothetical protein